VLVALIDTPFLYAAVWGLRMRFGLKPGEEINWNETVRTGEELSE